jgi:4-amino-4-deoxy-L-arabinose transferase-like glycosyltransferase
MTSNHLAATHVRPPNLGRSREVAAITLLTIAAAVIRAWSLGRLGLVHFDEGIYALAGLWSLSPRGLQTIDPTSIAYSPPGFPILIGLSYLWFGISDTSAILVSIIFGAATIPLVGWISLRTFGCGAGAAAAALAAFSALHISFSRMALTDASFLFVFLLALGQGQRFIERPNLLRAAFLGVSVGVAQLFKYNGGIAGIIVALAVAFGQIVSRKEQRTRTVCAMWGWGLFAILAAALVYWPWFQFVESHGGYRLLLAHQRGYMSGISTWIDHWSQQLAQAKVLSGSQRWRSSVGIVAVLGLLFGSSDRRRTPIRWPLLLIEVSGLTSLCVVPNFEWWAPLGWIAFMVIRRINSATPAMLVLGVGWLLLSIMTPFYHPYARLWLPLHAFGCIVIGGLFAGASSWLEATDLSPRPERKTRLNPGLGCTAVCISALAIALTSALRAGSDRFPSVFAPTDSLRVACRAIAQALPREVNDLRFFGRPALAYYLSLESRINLHSQPDLDHLLKPAGSTTATWCLLDSALLRQNGIGSDEVSKMTRHWATVRNIPTHLNLPTLLDIDPGSTYRRSIDVTASLLLLRPARPEVNR